MLNTILTQANHIKLKWNKCCTNTLRHKGAIRIFIVHTKYGGRMVKASESTEEKQGASAVKVYDRKSMHLPHYQCSLSSLFVVLFHWKWPDVEDQKSFLSSWVFLLFQFFLTSASGVEEIKVYLFFSSK